MRGHQEYLIPECRGLYNRKDSGAGALGVVPLGFLEEAENVVYRDNSIKQRFGIGTLHTALSNVLRFHTYQKISGSRLILLTSSGDVYDSTDLTTPILSSTGWTDFSGITLYDRFYFCGHNRIVGDSGSLGFLYVYNGTTARKAAGAKPASGVTAAVSATAGNVELGNRIYYVAYETDTGHITRPNDGSTVLNQNIASRSVDLSNIPTGPTGTVKRHLLATRRVDPYTGNPDHYDVYFIPGGVLNDNTTTTLTVNFYDADLLDLANYLFTELEEIPAFVGLGFYNGRFCGTAPASIVLKPGQAQQNTGVVRVSKAGFPESISDLDGFILVDPSDGGDVKALLPQSGSLYCFKDDRTFGTSDNGAEPANWPVVQIDSGLGSSVFGVGKILDSEGPSEDIAIVNTKAGLYTFRSGFAEKPLTFNIDGLFPGAIASQYYKSQIVIDPTAKTIYASIFNEEFILVGNYEKGLTPDTIRWSKYTHSSIVSSEGPTSIGLVPGGSTSIKYDLVFSAPSNTRIFVCRNSSQFSGSAIFKVGPIIPNNRINHFCGARILVSMQNTKTITTAIYNNNQLIVAGPNINGAFSDGTIKTILFNQKRPQISLRFASTGVFNDPGFVIEYPIAVYFKPLGQGPV